MQIDISLDDSDLSDLYDNMGATDMAAAQGIAAGDKAAWLRVNYLEPLIDSFLLQQIGSASRDKVYNESVAKAKTGEDALRDKVQQAQASRKDALAKKKPSSAKATAAKA